MKKFTTLLIAFVLFINIGAKADEGMWLLTLLNKNYTEMKEMGFELTPEDIYSINNGSMKDAIVMFGQNGRGFCTAEIISDQGLVLTNHHCGYGTIQYHSTVQNDYLKDGFWALSKEEELHTPGQFVKFLVSLDDVSAKVLKGVKDSMTEKERAAIIKKNAAKLKEKAIKGTTQEADVKAFFGGNQFFLLIYQVYDDVRFVGAPPSSVGKYGHDTDNWMWPRHTGDFSMFRVYMNKDGKAAEYDKSNVSLKPKHHLPVSIKGVEVGDFAMTMGYPGGTQRYMTSFEIDEVQNITHPNRVKLRGIRQGILMEDMKADPKINIQYASKYSRSSNYWKFSMGQSRGLDRLKVKDQKQKLEADFTKWVNANPARKAKYGKALSLIEGAMTGRAAARNTTQYLAETFFNVEIASIAGRTNGLLKLLSASKKDDAAIKAEIEKIKKSAEGFYKNYSMPTDKKVSYAMMAIYFKDIDAKYYPSIFKTIEADFAGDLQKFVDAMFAQSIFATEASLNAFLAAPDKDKLEKDLALQTYNSARSLYGELSKKSASFNTDFRKGHRLFVGGILEMNPDKHMYPDANFTMRLSYGQVGDYSPADAVHYDFMTTMDGIMEKYVPGDFEFDLPKKLIDIYNKKDYGQYALKDGRMPVCFTTNNDITGGNSGSPVINGKGELIGLAFDGNWEAMSGDIAFEHKLQKCINVDIRYVLFIIDKYAGATNIIEELDLKK